MNKMSQTNKAEDSDKPKRNLNKLCLSKIENIDHYFLLSLLTSILEIAIVSSELLYHFRL